MKILYAIWFPIGFMLGVIIGLCELVITAMQCTITWSIEPWNEFEKWVREVQEHPEDILSIK